MRFGLIRESLVGGLMSLFEVEGGRLIPAQFGRDVPGGITEPIWDAICGQVLQVIGRPLFPVTWRELSPTQMVRQLSGEYRAQEVSHAYDTTGQLVARLTALDAVGQVVAVAVARTLTSEVLIESLSKLADTAALSWADLAQEHPRGVVAFREEWAAFRDSLPTQLPGGPRLVFATAQIAGDVRPALDVLATSGVEVHQLSLRQMSNGRLFIEVEAVTPRFYGKNSDLLVMQGQAAMALTRDVGGSAMGAVPAVPAGIAGAAMAASPVGPPVASPVAAAAVSPVSPVTAGIAGMPAANDTATAGSWFTPDATFRGAAGITVPGASGVAASTSGFSAATGAGATLSSLGAGTASTARTSTVRRSSPISTAIPRANAAAWGSGSTFASPAASATPTRSATSGAGSSTINPPAGLRSRLASRQSATASDTSLGSTSPGSTALGSTALGSPSVGSTSLGGTSLGSTSVGGRNNAIPTRASLRSGRATVGSPLSPPYMGSTPARQTRVERASFPSPYATPTLNAPYSSSATSSFRTFTSSVDAGSSTGANSTSSFGASAGASADSGGSAPSKSTSRTASSVVNRVAAQNGGKHSAAATASGSRRFDSTVTNPNSGSNSGTDTNASASARSAWAKLPSPVASSAASPANIPVALGGYRSRRTQPGRGQSPDRADGQPVSQINLDEAGLSALAQALQGDTRLVMVTDWGREVTAELTRDGYIRMAEDDFTDPARALLALGMPTQNAWQKWRLGDRHGPTLAESVAELNAAIQRSEN